MIFGFGLVGVTFGFGKDYDHMYLQVFQGEGCRPGSLKGEANMNSPPFQGDKRLPAKEAER